MSEKGFPMKLRFTYIIQDSNKPCSHYLIASNFHQIVEVFERHAIEPTGILILKVNDQMLDDERIKKFFDWYKKRKGEFNYETRQETDSCTTTGNY